MKALSGADEFGWVTLVCARRVKVSTQLVPIILLLLQSGKKWTAETILERGGKTTFTRTVRVGTRLCGRKTRKNTEKPFFSSETVWADKAAV